MPFPTSKAAMIEAGYTHLTTRNCPCGAPMELWRTPDEKTLPMNPMPANDSKAESHFSTCPKAVQFRRAPRPKKQNLELF